MQTTAFGSMQPTTTEITSYTRFIEATCLQNHISSSVCLGSIVDTNAKTLQVQMNGDRISKEIISSHAGWCSRVYLRRVWSSQKVDVRRLKNVLDVGPVRTLNYHAHTFVNVVECVIEHKVVLCCPYTPKLIGFFCTSFIEIRVCCNCT